MTKFLFQNITSNNMLISADQFLKERGNRNISFEVYQKLPGVNSPERQQYLLSLSDNVAREVNILIKINACTGCGRSLLVSDSTCEHCGNTNDAYFDAISAEIDKHPIGRVM
jgi:hypothetical protein